MAMANTSAVALGTEIGARKQHIPKGAANVGAFISHIYGVHTHVLYMKSHNRRLYMRSAFSSLYGGCALGGLCLHMLRSTSVVFLSNLIQFWVILQSTKGILEQCCGTKKSLPRITTFVQTASTKGNWQTAHRSPNMNANTMPANVAVNCTLQLRNAPHISDGHEMEACEGH